MAVLSGRWRALVASTFVSVVGLVWLTPRVARADGVAITPEARSHFTAGVNLLRDPDGPRYEEAYREFKTAYASSPSYKILGNLGLCAMKLERDDEAVQVYEKYLTEGKDLSPSEIAQVKTDLATLKAGIVYLTLTTDPPGAKIFDSRVPVRGEKVTNVYGPVTDATRIGVRQGSHQITARIDGYPDVAWELEATVGSPVSHTFTFKRAEVAAPVAVQPAATPSTAAPAPAVAEAAPVAKRPVPAGVYIGAIATGLLTTGAVVTGLAALGKHSDFQAENNGSMSTQAQSDKSTGETLNVINDVCIGGAVAGAVLTVVLYTTRPTVTENGGGRAAAVSWRVTPLLGAGGGGVGVDGRF
ncbi:MAG: tetratricopeptide repeat protein [Polyangiaceae bacterium]